jgi:kynureninase
MSSLTVNVHLLMVSFYRPTAERHKILIEGGAFPSDQYAVASQLRYHGYDADGALIEARPRPGEATLRTEDLLALIEREGNRLALILLGNANYLTGQAFEVAPLAQAARERGIPFGLDLAHGAGNLPVELHDWGVDFAAWCSYKYLNSGPGAIAGLFVHEKHAGRKDLPRFEGWWGHRKQTRFEMPPKFEAIPTAEAWQLSNPPILQLAALRASLELFDRAGRKALRAKSERLTGYLEFLLKDLDSLEQLTPADPAQRGAQLSYRVRAGSAALVTKLLAKGVIADSREPDVIRFAPIPLYTSFEDVFKLSEALTEIERG